MDISLEEFAAILNTHMQACMACSTKIMVNPITCDVFFEVADIMM